MRLLTCTLIVLFLLSPAYAAHDAAATRADIELVEKLSDVIPGDAVFRDETGRMVNLKEMIDRPTIIAPVYLHCMHTCPILLTGLAESLGKIEVVRPGKDFRVIALSFDERDTPAIAAAKKRDYLKAVRRPFPPEAWTFLTGDEANIRKFTDAIGFSFQRDGMDFSHPVTVVVLAPGGKIVRYLPGVTFLPFSLTMAVTEAAEGKVGTATGRILNYCFSYDPLKQSYVFNILQVVGAAMILMVVGVIIFLLVTTKKHRGTS